MGQFHDQTIAATALAMANLETVIKNTVKRTSARIVDASPVDTGLFKGSYRFTVGEQVRDVPDTLDPSGEATLTAIAKAIDAAQIGGLWFLQNNQPYAIPLENGHSKQSMAMVRSGAQAAPGIAGEEARKLGGKA